jgi:hypothetical protein
LAELLAAGAWPDEIELPRTKAAFEAALAAARQRIGLAVQEVAGVIGPWFEAYREARAALDAAGGAPVAATKAAAASPGRKAGGKDNGTGAAAMKAVPTSLPSPYGRGAGGEGSSRLSWGKLALPAAPQAVKWQYAIDDVRDQLARLAGPKCLSTTPLTWLRHCPRYFRAIRVRLDALAGGGMAKDRERFEQFLPRWQSYLDWLQQHGPPCEADPELIYYRWMLEEYRVSLFAQKLGTSIPVSPKRLEQQWSKVKK